MEIYKDFIGWEATVRPEIEHVQKMLSRKLSDEPVELISDINEVEVWSSRMGSLLAQADSFLDRYTLIAMPPREGRTEADRKALVDSETAPIRVMRDTLESICEHIKQKLIWAESVLAFHRSQFPERKPGTPMPETARIY